MELPIIKQSFPKKSITCINNIVIYLVKTVKNWSSYIVKQSQRKQLPQYQNDTLFRGGEESGARTAPFDGHQKKNYISAQRDTKIRNKQIRFFSHDRDTPYGVLLIVFAPFRILCILKKGYDCL